MFLCLTFVVTNTSTKRPTSFCSLNLVVAPRIDDALDGAEMLMKFITYSLQVLGCDVNQSSQTSQNLLLHLTCVGREGLKKDNLTFSPTFVISDSPLSFAHFIFEKFFVGAQFIPMKMCFFALDSR